MDHENDYKIVEFDVYCPQCEHENLPEKEDPCDICLANPVNLNSKKPQKFVEKGEKPYTKTKKLHKKV